MWRALRRGSALLRAAALPPLRFAPLRADALRSIHASAGRQYDTASVRAAVGGRFPLVVVSTLRSRARRSRGWHSPLQRERDGRNRTRALRFSVGAPLALCLGRDAPHMRRC